MLKKTFRCLSDKSRWFYRWQIRESAIFLKKTRSLSPEKLMCRSSHDNIKNQHYNKIQTIQSSDQLLTIRQPNGTSLHSTLTSCSCGVHVKRSNFHLTRGNFKFGKNRWTKTYIDCLVVVPNESQKSVQREQKKCKKQQYKKTQKSVFLAVRISLSFLFTADPCLHMSRNSLLLWGCGVCYRNNGIFVRRFYCKMAGISKKSCHDNFFCKSYVALANHYRLGLTIYFNCFTYRQPLSLDQSRKLSWGKGCLQVPVVQCTG